MIYIYSITMDEKESRIANYDRKFVHIRVSPAAVAVFDNYKDHRKDYYNVQVHTNKTVPHPYFCASGRRHCTICRHHVDGRNVMKDRQRVVDKRDM